MGGECSSLNSCQRKLFRPRRKKGICFIIIFCCVFFFFVFFFLFFFPLKVLEFLLSFVFFYAMAPTMFVVVERLRPDVMAPTIPDEVDKVSPDELILGMLGMVGNDDVN